MGSLGIVLNSAGFGYATTSASSVSVGAGTKTFAVPVHLAYQPNQIVLAYSSGSAAWMLGSVTSYTGTTLVTSMTSFWGSGSHADWNLSLSGGEPPFNPGAWHAAFLNAAWSAVAGANTPRYRIEADGATVRLSGAVVATSLSSQIFTLPFTPVQYRPAHPVVMEAYDSANGVQTFIAVSVGASGVVSTKSTTSAQISLEGLTYPLT